MNETIHSTTRRTVLQRCLLFVAGAFGLPLTAPGKPPEPEVSPPQRPAGGTGPQTIRFFARRLQVHCASPKPGELPAWTGRLHSRTDLLDQPNGPKVGEFFATCLGPESPFGCTGADLSMELQTLKTTEGTLFGMGCAGPTAGAERAHAVLGGTGRFAGARGSYLIRRGSAAAGRESIEFVITLLT